MKTDFTRTSAAGFAADGFTLTELMATLAVAGILLSVAVPSFRAAMSQVQQDTAVYHLVGSLSFARSEAIKRSSRVSVCARASDASCGDDWNQGWLVFTDSGSNSGQLDADEQILKVIDNTPSSIALVNYARIANGTDPTQQTFIRFGPRGSSSWRNGGTFRFCDRRDVENVRALNVSMIGDVRTAGKDSTSNTLIDAYGESVSCPDPDGGN